MASVATWIASTGRLARRAGRGAAALVFRSAYAARRNARQATAEHRARRRVMRAGPRELTVETTTYCNLRCVVCPHSLEGEVHKQHLTEERLEQLAPWIPTTSRFQLHGLGEPLMSPAFWRLLDRIGVRHRGVPHVAFNTNGLLLTSSNIARLVASRVTEINISLDAASAAVYARIRGADLDEVLANAAALVRARNEAGRTDMRVVVNMTLVRANIDELPDFVRLARRLGADEAQFWLANEGADWNRLDWIVTKGAWRFSYVAEAPSRYPNRFNAAIREAMRVAAEIGMPIRNETGFVAGEGRFADWPYAPTAAAVPFPAPTPPAPRPEASGAAPVKSPTIGMCDAPWRWLYVRGNGDCYPCCFARGPVGNLDGGSIAQVWNSSTMQEMRAAIAGDVVHPLCRGAHCRFVRGQG